MDECLYPGCQTPTWNEGDKLSHWCLEHAWRFNRGDLLLNDHQRAELAEWPDDLRENNAFFFPVEFVQKKLNGRYRPAKHAVREATRKNTVCCDNQGTVVGNGCYPNPKCLKKCPPARTRQPVGSTHTYCVPCFIKIVALTPATRMKLGFDF